MFFLTPRYLKQAKQLHKGVTRFLDYKRDLLPAAKLEQITSLRKELEQAMKQRDRERLGKLTDELNEVCERALPEARSSELADNVEVFFVAIVIALGIRAYVAQPFQIPTGSMQPTLNGIKAELTAEDPRPGMIGNLAGFFTGTNYVNVVSDHSGRLRLREPITEHKFLIFMPYCKLHFEDGHSIKINCPLNQLLGELELAKRVNGRAIELSNDTPDRTSLYGLAGGEPIREGQLLARGIVTKGDHVLVNKFSYHFRQPTRGEVFVFTTNHILGINVPAEQGSQHYIKRLAGVPGDHLKVQSPKLFINGQEASESGFQRVMSGTFQQPADGYRGYSDPYTVGGSIAEIQLKDDEYFAMGDNSYNSSDSRRWGTVPERNVVGPALFCYWPLGSHWGPIK